MKNVTIDFQKTSLVHKIAVNCFPSVFIKPRKTQNNSNPMRLLNFPGSKSVGTLSIT
jgi:hypothetical protein